MRLEASHIGGKLAREVKVTDMANLQAVIYLAKGARVMCTWNGWKKAGLVNGAQGIVCDPGKAKARLTCLLKFLCDSRQSVKFKFIADLPM